jgi:hypothetical protein
VVLWTVIGRQIFYRRCDAWGQPFYTAEEQYFGEQGEPFYITFDTTLSRGYPAYAWVNSENMRQFKFHS